MGALLSGVKESPGVLAWWGRFHRCDVASVLWCMCRSCWLVLWPWSSAVDGTALSNGSIQQRYSGCVFAVPTRLLRQRDKSDIVQLLRHLQCQCWVRVQCGSDGINWVAVSSGTVQHERLGRQLQSVSEWHVRQHHWTFDCRVFGKLYRDHGVILWTCNDDSGRGTV